MNAALALAEEVVEGTFDLRAYLGRVIDDHPGADPREVALVAARSIPSQHRNKVLLLGLAELAREQMRLDRMEGLAEFKGKRTSQSWKDRGKKFLDVMYHVDGEWKQLGDFTAEDCEKKAAEHAEIAAKNAAIQEMFRVFAGRLKAAKVPTLRALPDDELQDLAA